MIPFAKRKRTDSEDFASTPTRYPPTPHPPPEARPPPGAVYSSQAPVNPSSYPVGYYQPADGYPPNGNGYHQAYAQPMAAYPQPAPGYPPGTAAHALPARGYPQNVAHASPQSGYAQSVANAPPNGYSQVAAQQAQALPHGYPHYAYPQSVAPHPGYYQTVTYAMPQREYQPVAQPVPSNVPPKPVAYAPRDAAYPPAVMTPPPAASSPRHAVDIAVALAALNEEWVRGALLSIARSQPAVADLIQAAYQAIPQRSDVDFDHYSKSLWKSLNATYSDLPGSRQYEAAASVFEEITAALEHMANEASKPTSTFYTKKSALATMCKIGKSIALADDTLSSEVKKRFQYSPDMEFAMAKVIQCMSEAERKEMADPEFIDKMQELIGLSKGYSIFERLPSTLSLLLGEERTMIAMTSNP